ncbi:hypothetical protein FQN54_005245 [Arachnomyces sp. PD_36]|nr:hypothetical protein FQN54_005245 [Arachnomyces sp. PD_36]
MQPTENSMQQERPMRFLKKRPLKAELVSQLKSLEDKVRTLDKKRAEASPDERGTIQTLASDALETSTGDNTSHTADIEVNRESQFGQLMTEGDTQRYVSHQALVTIENGENTNSSQDSGDYPSSDEETPPNGIGSAPADNSSVFLFGYHSMARTLRDLYPSEAVSQFLWATYDQNVAPLIKILYKPTAEGFITKVPREIEYLDKDSEALVFAVYFAAVASMKPHQIRAQFGDDHDATLLHYRFAVEQALARADFLHTQSLIVLQAAVLYLVTVWRSRDTQFVWTMAATVYRVSQGLGLHRDGTKLGLNPFETEMRRRIWWHIYALDAQTSEHLATNALIQEGTYDTRFPLNINDDDIHPDSIEPVKEHTGFTESTFLLIRCEMTASPRQSMHRLKPKTNGCYEAVEGYSQILADLNSLVETRYLQFYNIQVPIQWTAATMARIILARAWLVAHLCLLKSDSVGTAIWHQKREAVFITALEILEFQYLLETNERTVHWSWLFEMCQQWHALAFVLSELCVRPDSPASDRAWTIASVVYRQWKQRPTRGKWVLWGPLSRLMKRVSAIRACQQEMDAAGLTESALVQGSLLVDSLHTNPTWVSSENEQTATPASLVDIEAARESMDLYMSVMGGAGHGIPMD